ncbi:MAG: hypothetical protein K5790_10550 [Nitrosopumilus sp.]|uniref:hypothetical protein n=1 Tax=Nitrosopumilus sp. TaxID=2024843 RepID=UPI00247BC5A7|nr:hypothetical protein [Nitrosopumilus sp.]MCV0393710.1 hypothetical protein [Nitrosopumilus sp.]
MNSVLLFLQTIALQTSKEFLEGTRTSVSGDIVSSLGESVITIISLVIAGAMIAGFVILMKGWTSRTKFPEGRKIKRIRIANLDGTEYDVNVSENESFVKHELKQLEDSGYVKEGTTRLVERLQTEDNFHVYNAKIIKYGNGVRWRSKNRNIQIHTRVSLENPDYFSNSQRGLKSWSNMLEPEIMAKVFVHSISTIGSYKTYNGKMKQVHSLAVLPTNPKKRYAQFSDIFKDKHVTIPMSIDALEPELSQKLGNIIEWTPKVSQLEQDNKNKEVTLKKFNSELSVKSKKLSKFNMAINKLFGALEQKRLTGNEVKRDPIKMSSNIMLSMVSVFIGGISYSAWLSVPELVEYSPWFGVIVATIVIGVLTHANEKRKKEELEAQDIDIN